MRDFSRHNLMVISGGQTGVDLAGLRAAKCLGFKTGGFAPRWYRTTLGPRPTLRTMFNLNEHSGGYIGRTIDNVLISHATLIIAANIDSPGTKLTIETCEQVERPYAVIQLQPASGNLAFKVPTRDSQADMVRWLQTEAAAGVEAANHFVLNIAGNSSESAPGIFAPAFLYLLGLFTQLHVEACSAAGAQPEPAFLEQFQRLFHEGAALALTDNYDRYIDLEPRRTGPVQYDEPVYTREAV